MNYLKNLLIISIISILLIPLSYVNARSSKIKPSFNQPLPLIAADQGMITFSFDDATKGAYKYGLPLMKKFGIKGCINPIIAPIENNEDWVVTWDELKEFKKAGWEIGSHSMTHPYLTSLSDKQLDYELKESKSLLEQHGFNPQTFVFPYGDQDYRVYDYVTRYYQNARLAWGNGGFNKFPFDRYKLVTVNIDNSTPPAVVKKWIDRAVKEKLWLVLMLHDITIKGAGSYQYNIKDLTELLKYVRINQIPTATIIEALNYHQDNNLIVNFDLNKVTNGWASNWYRTNKNQVSLATGVNRIFSRNNQLHLQGGAEVYSAEPKMINLPKLGATYLFSMFANIKTNNSGAAIWLNEFDKHGNYLGGQWLGGIYYTTFSMPEYLYTPSSSNVASILIDIYSEPGDVSFLGDNFYFGLWQ